MSSLGRFTVEEAWRRIDELDGDIQAFRETYRDRGGTTSTGPLAGVPIAIKDNIVTDFGHSACGSRFLERYESPYTATAAQKLLDAGGTIVGRTNCDEFAMGSSTENCAFGVTRNPWDLSRVPGGSSGGSAAAVAAGMVPGALGSETGGSIRQPAAMCGIVGVKPSYGRVSRYGLVAFGSSLDQIGPLARDVRDAALLLQVVAGHDPRDSTSSPGEVPDYLEHIDEPVEGLRLGLPKQFLRDDNDPAVNDAVRDAIGTFRGLGAEIIDIDLPLTDYGIATYYVIATAEASSNLARYDGIRYGRRAEPEPGEDLYDLYARSRAEGFGPEVQRRIMLGTYVLSAGYHDAYYLRALQVRRLIKQEYDAAFEKCHALIGPTSPCTAFKLGEKTDPLSMYLCDLYTVNTNLAGICAMSVPCGLAPSPQPSPIRRALTPTLSQRERERGGRLPIGLQIQCKPFDEATMFRIARTFEAATPHHKMHPFNK